MLELGDKKKEPMNEATKLVKENDLLFAASKRGEFKMLPQTVKIKEERWARLNQQCDN
jgi:hypothetical protein